MSGFSLQRIIEIISQYYDLQSNPIDLTQITPEMIDMLRPYVTSDSWILLKKIKHALFDPERNDDDGDNPHYSSRDPGQENSPTSPSSQQKQDPTANDTLIPWYLPNEVVTTLAYVVVEANAGYNQTKPFPSIHESSVINDLKQGYNMIIQSSPGVDNLIHLQSAVSPQVVSKPNNPSQVIVVFEQGKWNTHGSMNIAVSRSTDGGRIFDSPTIISNASVSNVLGGKYQRVSLQSLVYTADGTILLLTALYSNTHTSPSVSMDAQSVVISFLSYDDGMTWNEIECNARSSWVIDNTTNKNINTIATNTFTQNTSPTTGAIGCACTTMDPVEASRGYVVYNQYHDANSTHADTYLSRTWNGGQSWSYGALIYNPDWDVNVSKRVSNNSYDSCQTLYNKIIVLPEYYQHQLLNVMLVRYAKPQTTTDQFKAHTSQSFETCIAVIRSQDEGRSFTHESVIVAKLSSYNFDFTRLLSSTNSNTNMMVKNDIGKTKKLGAWNKAMNNVIMTQQQYGVDVNQANGNIYIVYVDGESTVCRSLDVLLKCSRDGGETWQSAIKINKTPPNVRIPIACCPNVAVSYQGYVAVCYRDFRYDTTNNLNQTLMDTFVAIYRDSVDQGLVFIQEIRLTQTSQIVQHYPMIKDESSALSLPSLQWNYNQLYIVMTAACKESTSIQPKLVYEDKEGNRASIDNSIKTQPELCVLRIFSSVPPSSDQNDDQAEQNDQSDQEDQSEQEDDDQE